MGRWPKALRSVASALAIVVMASSCSDGRGSASPSTTAVPASEGERPATTSTTVVPDVPGRPAAGGCPAVPARRRPDPDRPRYVLDVDVDVDAGVVTGRVRVSFTPDLPVDRLVFRLWPNGPRPAGAGARLDVGPVVVDGAGPVDGRLPDPTTLVVPLAAPVAAGDTVTAELPWHLTLPGSSNDRLAHEVGSARLGSFYPVLAWEPGVGWATDPPTGLFAEASTAPTADVDLHVRVPDGFDVLASGEPVAPDRWRALAVRDVALSVGRFRRAEATTTGGVRVTVGVAAGLADDPFTYLDLAVRSLDDLAGRYGPYPWPSLTMAVTPGLGGGIEYPGHLMMGPGTADRTVPHEVAHQWFYALVGNDQGRDPWLDEGLATWGEARVLGTLPAYVRRALATGAAGRLGEPMTFWERRPAAYYSGVYVQGAQALAALGPPEVVDCALAVYVARHAHRVAAAADLAGVLGEVFPEAPSVLARFGA